MCLQSRGPRCRASGALSLSFCRRPLFARQQPAWFWGAELSPRALLRAWYVKGVFETDDSLDPGRDVTGYAVLVSSFGLGGEQLAQCSHDGCARAAYGLNEGLVAAVQHHRAGRGHENLSRSRRGNVRCRTAHFFFNFYGRDDAQVQTHLRFGSVVKFVPDMTPTPLPHSRVRLMHSRCAGILSAGMTSTKPAT